MEEIKRFGVSIENGLLEKFDRYINSNNYQNRSEALRDLIRKELIHNQWTKTGEEVAGAIVMVYDHHSHDVVGKLLDIQHDYSSIIISTQHIHLDHNNCLEIVVVKGKIGRIDELASKLKSIKGVKHATLSRSTLGKNI
jgi:CopG family transcriptional regulator, nickel-responsive regulator